MPIYTGPNDESNKKTNTKRYDVLLHAALRRRIYLYTRVCAFGCRASLNPKLVANRRHTSPGWLAGGCPNTILNWDREVLACVRHERLGRDQIVTPLTHNPHAAHKNVTARRASRSNGCTSSGVCCGRHPSERKCRIIMFCLCSAFVWGQKMMNYVLCCVFFLTEHAGVHAECMLFRLLCMQ